MELKDSRFKKIATKELKPTDGLLGKRDRPDTFGSRFLKRATGYIEFLEGLARRDNRSFERLPVFIKCGYCKRMKHFPCNDAKDMQLTRGLCPDQTCANQLVTLGIELDEPVEKYPVYRA